jgi:hypothetical protein
MVSKPEKSTLRRSKDRSHCKSTRDSAHRWMKVGAQVKDDDDRKVYFFHRGCITPNYLPRKGDHIAFNLRTNPRGGGLEAFNFELLAPA